MAWVALLDVSVFPSSTQIALVLAVACGVVALAAWWVKSSKVRMRKIAGSAVFIVFGALTAAFLLLTAALVIMEKQALDEKRERLSITCFINQPHLSCSTYKIHTGGALELEVGQQMGKNITVIAFACSQNSHAVPESLEHNITVPNYSNASDLRWIVGGDSGNSVFCTDEAGARISESDSPVGTVYSGKTWIRYVETGENGSVTKEVWGDLGGRFEP